MSRGGDRSDLRELLEGALLEIRRLRSELAARERDERVPVAIVGMGCRFPGGVESPEAYWRLLRDGVDAVGEVPPSRWDAEALYDADPDAPGKIYTRYGGFLGRVDEFDAGFFGVSSREADAIDPQHRLLLEVCWEALERAGQAPDALAGSRTGVFAGLFMDDYARLTFSSGDPARADAYSTLGNLRSMAAGRVAYTLGLQGPVMQLDTACSSSLLAVHLACQSLRERECDLALAGGVNLLLAPEPSIGVCRLHALAPDGRCKTFDARADGFARGEGCGVVVLERLPDAIANRRSIVAVIRGSAVNHDGRSNGLTAPNGAAQEAVIRRALEAAGVGPADVGYVEAHGTGTMLGDPVEVLALASALGGGRAEPLVVGSVKTNFGHLEAAAGVASLMKAALAVRHGEIPPHLHLERPNPYIPWDRIPVSVATSLTPWPASDRPRVAGVSAFGMSGTNVHAVLEQPPAEAGSPDRGIL